jgi:hypothetical protein
VRTKRSTAARPRRQRVALRFDRRLNRAPSPESGDCGGPFGDPHKGPRRPAHAGKSASPTVDSATHGGVPERSKGTDCKFVGSAFAGSNPAPATTDAFCDWGWSEAPVGDIVPANRHNRRRDRSPLLRSPWMVVSHAASHGVGRDQTLQARTMIDAASGDYAVWTPRSQTLTLPSATVA